MEPLMAKLPTLKQTTTPAVKRYANEITGEWRKAVDGILAVGQLLQDAESNLSAPEWVDLYAELPFSKSTADKLLEIARDTRLLSHKEHLPPSWGTLYEITQLDDAKFHAGLSQGLITPAVERQHIIEYKRQTGAGTTAVANTQAIIAQSAGKATLATVSIQQGFDIGKVGSLQRDLQKLVAKYGAELKFDKSKKGVLGMQRDAIAEDCKRQLTERAQNYGKISSAKLEALETALDQLKRTSSGKPKLVFKQDPKTGEYQKNDIRHPKHPYHGKTLKEIYDYVRDEKLLTRHSGLKEIDKEAWCIELLRQHCEGNARSRADAIIKLKRLVSRGDDDTKVYAQRSLDMLLEG
jgi:hypothetical protein